MKRSPSRLSAEEMMIIIIVLTAIAAVVLFLAPDVGIASAQQLTSIPAVIQNGTFQNTEDGFRMQVPDDWVVQDIDNLHLPNFRVANEAGFLILAIICPQQEALLGIGGMYNCEQSESSVEILHDRLSHRPEFEVIEDPANITSDDFLVFMVEEMQGRNYTNIQIINRADLTINITSPQDPNTTIRTVPAKLVEMTYRPSPGLVDMRSYSILATIPENPQPGLRQIVSGESVTYEGPAAATPSGSPPPPVQQIFQSLEFIR
ncbi:MAG: hypothetical protein M3136_12660 [Thermoproteota archaeon]|jgi:hypothetical protein|nr:hypothetical protein [Thermoproteota archaeon]